MVNWVACADGPDLNPGVAATNPKMVLGLTVIAPWNRHVPSRHGSAETQVILSGTAIAEAGSMRHRLGRLNALWRPATEEAGLRNTGDAPLYLLWVRDQPG